jgi:site-specific recombinase XerD
LRNYLTYLFDKKNLKETSIKRRMASLKAMFHWLESEELLANKSDGTANYAFFLFHQIINEPH